MTMSTIGWKILDMYESSNVIQRVEGYDLADLLSLR